MKTLHVKECDEHTQNQGFKFRLYDNKGPISRPLKSIDEAIDIFQSKQDVLLGQVRSEIVLRGGWSIDCYKWYGRILQINETFNVGEIPENRIAPLKRAVLLEAIEAYNKAIIDKKISASYDKCIC